MARDIRVLVVDDDENIHNLYRSIFKLPQDNEEDEALSELFDLLDVETVMSGQDPLYPVELCSQGIEAIRAVQESVTQGSPFSHALIDMRMPPGIDGLETAQRILKVDPDIQVTFVTAYADYTAEEIMEKVGDNYSYVQKPFNEESILTRIESKH